MPVAELTADQGTAVTAPDGCGPDSAGEERQGDVRRPKDSGFSETGDSQGQLQTQAS